MPARPKEQLRDRTPGVQPTLPPVVNSCARHVVCCVRGSGTRAAPPGAQGARLKPSQWRRLSAEIRFVRAAGRCERCQRPHGRSVAALPGGFWWNEEVGYWLDTHGRRTTWHRIAGLGRLRTSRVMLVCVRLAAPTDEPVGLVALCKTCLMAHRAAAYRMTRRLARLRRYALGDLFDGPYPAAIRI